MKNRNVIWKPYPGSQTAFLSCPHFEVLYHGTRGPGKSDALLMAFIKHVGLHGNSWRGIIFRRTYKQLEELCNKSETFFRPVFRSKVKFNRHQMVWEWEGGEKLFFRNMTRHADYWNYHGHEYPFIGWDELTNWPDAFCYKTMIGCCRSSNDKVPLMIRATTNPYGPGHSWIKKRFLLAGSAKKIQIIKSEGTNRKKVAIHGNILENEHLLKSNPEYINTLKDVCSNPEMLKAWIHGDWDIISGGMFSDVWSKRVNVIPAFPVPSSWRIDRSFDWGSSAPFSVGWWAESDGTNYIDGIGDEIPTVRGDIFRIDEWYGCDANKQKEGLKMLTRDIALEIKVRERLMSANGLIQTPVQTGVADSSIFNSVNGTSYADEMRAHGVLWNKADKSPGSRKAGWEVMRRYMKDAALPAGNKARERPGLFIFKTCCKFIETIPDILRDDKDMDDIDPNAEDHIADETRYRLHNPPHRMRITKTTGMNF